MTNQLDAMEWLEILSRQLEIINAAVDESEAAKQSPLAEAVLTSSSDEELHLKLTALGYDSHLKWNEGQFSRVEVVVNGREFRFVSDRNHRANCLFFKIETECWLNGLDEIQEYFRENPSTA